MYFAVLSASTFCLTTSHAVAITSSACAEIPPGVSLGLSQENDAATKTTTKPEVVSAAKWHRRRCSHAGNHLADSNVQWPTQITHRKWLMVMQGQEMSWWRWSQVWVRIPWITLLCQHHYLIKLTSCFMWWYLCTGKGERMLESAKTVWRTAASSAQREKLC